jgi:molybdopterin-guanine dinucleotide biosynthesis protein MobB
MNDFPLPIIGFCAYSGIGKTTLLTKLISLLTTEGIRVGVVKHAHHDFDIDHPGKDSYELRHAGASQMLVASRRRTALIVEHKNPLREPKLADVLTNLRLEDLDLVLVEGFKQEAIPKIELHRSGMNRPLLFPSDPNVVAIACDYEIDPGNHPVTTLDINDIQQISLFIRQYMPNKRVAAIC